MMRGNIPKKFFVDENLSERLAQILHLTFKGTDVASIKKHYGPKTHDIVWMRDLATWSSPQPVVLTCDRRIKGRIEERQALRESGLRYIIIQPSWMDFPFHEQVWRLVKVWPEVQAQIDSIEDGYGIVEVDVKRGTVLQSQ